MLLLAARIGEEEVARWCAALLTGIASYDDSRWPPITWLGGLHAASDLRRGDIEGRGQDYWARVWAARALTYVYQPLAEEATLAGLRDPAWRVRELSAKIARRHRVVSAEPILARLLDDAIPRVRVAAESALTESARSKESRTPRSSRARPPRR